MSLTSPGPVTTRDYEATGYTIAQTTIAQTMLHDSVRSRLSGAYWTTVAVNDRNLVSIHCTRRGAALLDPGIRMAGCRRGDRLSFGVERKCSDCLDAFGGVRLGQQSDLGSSSIVRIALRLARWSRTRLSRSSDLDSRCR